MIECLLYFVFERTSDCTCTIHINWASLRFFFSTVPALYIYHLPYYIYIYATIFYIKPGSCYKFIDKNGVQRCKNAALGNEK